MSNEIHLDIGVQSIPFMASSIAAVDLAFVVKDFPGDKLNDDRGEIW